MDSYELRAELEKHHRESYGWALSCCARNPAEAENVLQAVYLKALEGKARFNGQSSFKTWLFAVIRKTAIDEAAAGEDWPGQAFDSPSPPARRASRAPWRPN